MKEAFVAKHFLKMENGSIIGVGHENGIGVEIKRYGAVTAGFARAPVEDLVDTPRVRVEREARAGQIILEERVDDVANRLRGLWSIAREAANRRFLQTRIRP